MKLREIITEVRMNPSSLVKMVSNIKAIAGIEFEMYCKQLGGTEDNSVESFTDIEDYFRNQFNLDDHKLEKILYDAKDEYMEWLQAKADSEFENSLRSMPDYIATYIMDTYYDEDEETLNQHIEDATNDPDHDDAIAAVEQYRADNQDDWINEYIEEYYFSLQPKWFRKKDITTVTEFEQEYMASTTSTSSIDDIADSFGTAIDLPVEIGYSYHGVARTPGVYIVEPDSSLDEPTDEGDLGLEFISPPLPLVDMLNDMDSIVAWASSNGCYTNSSCGLHMNISIEGVDNSKLDYVKLALFVGEDYILEKFGREGNTYASRVLNKLARTTREHPVEAVAVLEAMASQLSSVATKIIHSGITSHNDGLNVHDNYVEFRYAGNDWLNEDFKELANTLMRYVVAYSIACDPEAYKQEYAKKLYKLISPADDKVHTLQFFSNYVSGGISKEQLIKFVKQSRKIKDPTTAQHENRYMVHFKPGHDDLARWVIPNGAMTVASSEKEAIAKVRQRFNIDATIPDDWFLVVVKSQDVN